LLFLSPLIFVNSLVMGLGFSIRGRGLLWFMKYEIYNQYIISFIGI